MKELTFVTGNKHKLLEVQAILGSHIPLRSQAINVPELQGTTQEIAIAKCRAAAKVVDGPVVTEDTSLGFTALQGLPGPYIKDFMSRLGHTGLNTLLYGFNDTRATALCTFAYSPHPGADPLLFEGRCEGRIVPARGATDFGWDAIFESTELGKTFGEANKDEKNTVSHRYRALAKLRSYLEQDKAGKQLE